MKRMLFLGGNWIDDIRESGYTRKFYSEMLDARLFDIEFQNGGTVKEMNRYLNRALEFDVILWFVNVPNSHEKTVGRIKEINPKAILVTSKNNLDGKYGYMELVARMLKVKSNLMVEFGKAGDAVTATVLDPLNNAFCMKEPDVRNVARVLSKRIDDLLHFSRVGSRRVGEALPVPDEAEFFEIGRRLAETFHTLIHPEHTERFLGNMSFRCENGFPSFRRGDLVYVSRRNIDKRLVGADGFVAVNAASTHGVEYYGDAKPSVDTPVQVALYSIYRNVRYMIHSHVYASDGPVVADPIPCGAIEEVEAIHGLCPNEDESNFAVNLLGHGSIVLASDLDYFRTVRYIARPCPEVIKGS